MNRQATDSPFAKVAVFLLTVLIGLLGWIGKNLHADIQLTREEVKLYRQEVEIAKQRLTIVESTVIDRTEAVKRLAVLEHRVDVLEKAPE